MYSASMTSRCAKSAIAVGFMILCLYPLHVLSQATENEARPKQRRWDFAVHLGTTFQGPAKGSEKAMTDAGFDDPEIGCFLTCGPSDTDYPFSNKDRRIDKWMINVRYLFRPPLAAGLIVSAAKMGSTFGYNDITPDQADDPASDRLSLGYSMTTMAAVISVRVKALRLGIGPALYFVKTESTVFRFVSFIDITTTRVHNQKRKLGLIADFGLATPADSFLYGELRAQYRFTGKVKIPPLEQYDFPAIDTNYNHFYIGLGIGVRI